MKVMVIVKATPESEAGELPSEQLLADMGRYNEELVKAGVMLAGEGLHPSSRGKRVLFSGKDRLVTDGPFAETKELIAGFWMWRVQSMDEAVEWIKRCPNPMQQDSVIEIRQVFEAEDFGEAFTPELRQQEASLRAQNLGLGEVRFEDRGEFLVGGMNASYTLETRPKIGGQWEQFIQRLPGLPGRIGAETYGVCWNQSGCSFDYLTGAQVAEGAALPAGFQTVRIPAGRYAVLGHRGPIASIPATFDAIWSKWVPDCGLKIAARPSFERYTDKFNPATSEGMDIWIPLDD